MKTPSLDIRQVALKDVAKACGVTLPTASKILSGNDGSMAEETIKRVRETAKKMGYRPHFAAKILNGRRTGITAIVFASNDVGAEEQNRLLALHLATRLQAEGESVIFQALGAAPLEEVLEMINRGCQSFLFIATPPEAGHLEKAMEDNACPWLCIKGEMSRRIGCSYADGVREILAGWVAKGRQFRLLIESENPADQEHFQYRHRFAGLKALFPDEDDAVLFRRHVRPMRESGPAQALFEAGFESTRRVLETEIGVDALFYDTDLHALGGIRCLVTQGLTPGKDVLVAGANNLELASRFGAWPFPSVGMDFTAIAQLAAARLKEPGAFAVDLPPLVFHRSSDFSKESPA